MTTATAVASSRAILAHPGVRWVGLGWSGFIAENVVLSHNRDVFISRWGEGSYHTAYSALSTLASASIAWGYLRHGAWPAGGRAAQPRLWSGPLRSPLARGAALLLQAAGLVGFSQMAPKLQPPVMAVLDGGAGEGGSGGGVVGPATPQPSATSGGAGAAAGGVRWQAQCPFDFSPPDLPADGVHGLKRVSRHHQMWSLGTFGLGCALATPFAAPVVFFSFPALFALVGGAHQDYRYRRGSGGWLSPEREAATSHLPFGALLAGRQSWSKLDQELKGWNAAAAVGVAAALALRRGRRMRLPKLQLLYGSV